MADMAQRMLDMLPNFFLMAGLQMIVQGNWPMGLAFIAAAGSSALIAGYTQGKINEAKDAAANAHGNVFDANGVVPYAHGGAFTNQIVSSPTYFRYGGKFGVMGEAGPESIMPLRRMANGDLGVAADGAGGAKVTVNIINNTSTEVRQEESTDAEGNRQIDVVIGQLVNSHISSGKADRAIGGRYGLRALGV
jgi:phage-related minor tail protein